MPSEARKPTQVATSKRCLYQHAHLQTRFYQRLVNSPTFFCLLILFVYLQAMDLVLFFKIRSRGLLDLNAMKLNSSTLDPANQKWSSTPQGLRVFEPLPMKKIMIGQMSHFVQSPIAEYIGSRLHFTYYFPSITANKISLFHCFLSLISLKFFSSESLSRRQIGVVIFQIRSFLDCLDGVVFRANAQNQHYKSYHGNTGYYLDAVSDVVGGISLLVGCLLYLCKHRPWHSASPRQASPVSLTPTKLGASLSIDLTCDAADLLIIHDEPPALLPTHQLFETKRRILIFLGHFAVRYILAAVFWDRSVCAYERLLDASMERPQQQALQLSILQSPLTIFIFYLWRYLSALSIQEYLTLAIFFDRTWEFLEKTNTISWILLLLTMLLSEMHVAQTQAIFSHF